MVIVLHSCFALFQNKALEFNDIMLGFSLSFLVYSAITGIQMPLFFKMGYTKAKFWSMVPFIVVMVLVAAPAFVSALSGVIKFMQSHETVLIISAILVSCLIQFFSYLIAIVLYRKRKRG